MLSHYGGLWIDSTIVVTADIPDEIFEYNYYVVRHEDNFYSHEVNRGRWMTYLQGGKKKNLLCSFCRDFLIDYWKKENLVIDYMLMDYVVEIAYQEFPECKNLLDSVPLNNPEIKNLRPLLNLPFDPKKFASIKSSTMFFKITYKHKFQKHISGVQTFYGHIIETNS